MRVGVVEAACDFFTIPTFFDIISSYVRLSASRRLIEIIPYGLCLAKTNLDNKVKLLQSVVVAQ